MNLKGNEELERQPSDEEPFAALAFKIMTDPHVGKLTYFRVYSGKLEKGGTVVNTTNSNKERIGRILQMHANSREDIDQCSPATSRPASASRTPAPVTRCPHAG